MKLTDVDNKLSEDIGSWLGNTIAKTGIRGRTEKLSAQQQDAQRRIYDTGLKYFKNELGRAIQSGVKSGFIQVPTATSQQAAAQTAQPSQPSQTSQSEQPPQSDTSTGATPSTSTPSTAPSDDGQSAISSGIELKVPPGERLVIPKRGVPDYYKLSNGKWYNFNGQVITKSTSIQELENRADAGGARMEKLPGEPPTLAQQRRDVNKSKTKTKESSGKFELLTSLLENRILNEQDSVSGFIQDFVNGQTNTFVDNPKYEDFIKRVANSAQKEYSETGKISDKTYEQLWSTIFNWSKMGRGTGKSSGSPRPAEIDTDSDKNDNGIKDTDERIQWHDKVSNELNSIDPNDPRDLEKMKKIAVDLYKFVQSSEKQQ